MRTYTVYFGHGGCANVEAAGFRLGECEISGRPEVDFLDAEGNLIAWFHDPAGVAPNERPHQPSRPRSFR